MAKRGIFLINVAVGIGLLYFYSMYTTSYTRVLTRHKDRSTTPNKTLKTILLWNTFFGSKDFGFGRGQEAFVNHKCKVSTCEMWHRDDTEVDMAHDMYDAVIIHGIGYWTWFKYDVPTTRRPEQRYFDMNDPPVPSLAVAGPGPQGFVKPSKEHCVLLYRLSRSFCWDCFLWIWPKIQNAASGSDLRFVMITCSKYIFLSQESPQEFSLVYDHKNFFNWTATYRRDSDIYCPYISIVDSNTTGGRPSLEYQETKWREPDFENIVIPYEARNKTRTIAWFVSHKHTHSLREKYAHDLSKYVPVDVYGRFDKFYCDKNDALSCNKLLRENYKFYLSFENGLCDDYITEKLFRAYNNDLVPIAYGGADYSKFVPPMSYINIKDFVNAEDLARYLLYLDQHPEEYRKYFWWKNYYKIADGRNLFCDICEKLHSDTKPKVYEDIKVWWDDKYICRDPSFYFQKLTK